MRRFAVLGWWTILAAMFCMAGGGATHDGLLDRFRQDRMGQGVDAVKLARRAIEFACRTRDSLPPPDDLPPLLHERGAVFVSAMIHGAPRCCMGTLIPRQPSLAVEIIANATAAAIHDKRFPPLRRTELPRLRVIVSVVGEMESVADPLSVNPLTDGLAVRGSRETGVVLPGETGQAATMVKWGCIRAGIRRGEKAEFYRLSAVRFMEPPHSETEEDGK